MAALARKSTSSVGRETIADKMNKEYMIQSLKDHNLPSTEGALSYTEYNGPLVPYENVMDCQKVVLDFHRKWSANQQNKYYIEDVNERIEEEQQIAIHYLVVHARFTDFMIVGKPLPILIDYTISIINGKNVNIGEMLMDRIRQELVDNYKKIEKSDIIKSIKYN